GELADLCAHPVTELHRDLAVTGLVPALPGHVELQLEGNLVAAGAHVVVPARATSALQRLQLAHEDAVHQVAGPLRRVWRARIEPPAAAGAVGLQPPHGAGPRVAERLLHLDAREALVPGQLLGRHVPLHRSPSAPRPAIRPAP